MDRPSLSILIPTYNRAQWLEALLRALARDPGVRSESVSIVVSDNVSRDHTAAMVRFLQREFPTIDLRLVVQEENLGSIGNIKWLIRQAEADYVWVFGDDDEPAPGAVDFVLDLLADVSPAVLHLPHIFQAWPGAPIIESPCPDEIERLASSRELLLGTHHWLSFLSASVVRRANMLQALEDAPTESPWGPHIWFSIAGRDEVCAVAPRRLVHGGGSVGWQSLKQVFFTTRLIEAFDEGFNLVVDELEYGRLLDHRYQVDWAEQWETAPLDELRAAVERFPTSRLLRWKLGERTKRKPTPEVLELLRTSVRDCGDDVVAKEMIAAGEEKFHDGDLRGAARTLYRALVVDPTNVNGWCDLGVVWNALGKFEAVQAFERALTLDPEHCDTLLNRADWAMDRGLKGLAGSDAERVLAVEPDNESAHDILARTDWLPAGALQR